MNPGHFSFFDTDSEHVRALLARLHGENRFAFLSDDRRAHASIQGRSVDGVSVVRARFSTAFRMSMEGLPHEQGGLAIFLRASGSARIRTIDARVDCEQGCWIPFMSGATREVETTDSLRDIAVIIAPSIVAAACRDFLQAAPGETLKLDATPFSPLLAAKWGQVVRALDALALIDDCPADAVASVAARGLSLILQNHSHNLAVGVRRHRIEPKHASDRPHPHVSLRPALAVGQIQLLQAHIRASLDRPINVAKLARLVGMGTTRFGVAFRQAFGMTPGRYVRDQRLRRAMWLLEHKSLTIAQIAADTGYSSQSHLVARMIAVVGMTPREYRRSRRLRQPNPQ